jgi:hypothetical protein
VLDTRQAGPNVVIRQKFFGPEFRRRFRHGLWLLPLVGIGFAHGSLQTALWSLAGVTAFTVVAYALTAAILGHATLGVVDGTIRRTSWLGGSVSCPRSSVARVVEVSLSFTPLGYGERFLLFLDRNDRTLLRAYAGYYAPEELARFAAALALPWDGFGRRVTAAQARRALPGSFPWPWAHYLLTTLALLVAAYLAAVVVFAIVMAVG